MGKFATNASGVMLLLNSIQVTESISGSVVLLAMFVLPVTFPDVLTPFERSSTPPVTWSFGRVSNRG